MGSIRERCRCCFSPESLETMQNPDLDVYMMICNLHDLEIDEYGSNACFQCLRFLKDVYKFRIKCHAANKILRNHPDVQNNEIELMLRNAIGGDSSDVKVKIEVMEESNEIDEIEFEVTKVEMDSEPENSPEMLDTAQNDAPRNDNILYESVNCTGNELMIELNENPEYYSDEEETNVSKQFDEPLRDEEPPPVTGKFNESLIDEHPAIKIFECNVCSYKTNLKNYMTEHQKTHLNKRLFSCETCSYTTTKRSYLKRHMRNKLRKPIKCNECSFTSLFPENVRRHIIYKHRNERPFVCDLCDYRAKTRSMLTQHKKWHSKPFKCEECSFQCSKLSYLKTHTVAMHKDPKLFHCDHCSYRAKDKNTLIHHMSQHFSNYTTMFECRHCPYKSTNLHLFKVHTKVSHNDDKRFHCEMCDFQTKAKKGLVRHMQNHSELFKCTECSYQSWTLRYFKLHISIHKGRILFPCKQCDFICSIRSRLDIHTKVVHCN